jgi:hypothetical protein
MNDSFLEKVLHDIQYQVNEVNKSMINNVLKNSKNDIQYVWSKMKVLIDSLAHVKGYVALANSQNAIKIAYDRNVVSEEIAREFSEITRNWADKYKIELDYDWEKDYFYIK